MNQDSIFWDKVSEKYSLKPVPDEGLYSKKLEITRQYLDLESVVLEFGCGTGTTSLKHAADAKSIIAYDFSPEMIRIANERKSKLAATDNVTFEVAAIEDIDFGKSKFDVIMGHSVLHLTLNNENILKMVYQGLKKGGVFISGSGCMKDMNPLIRLVIRIAQFFFNAPNINYFTANELVALHESVVFEIDNRWDYKKGEIYLVAKK